MKYRLILCLFLGFAGLASAQQRYAVIDTKYILDKIPEYKDAEKNYKLLVCNGKKKLTINRLHSIKCIR
ncbi:MAG: hypothetical protein NT153_05960, partial [Bacteroidetes bacterium]|nr:hypothetical protein [Bacteroidota bacterium]